MSEISFITSQRGGQLLRCGDFMYRIHCKQRLKKYWKCMTETCRARVITMCDQLERKCGSHNHEAQRNEIDLKCLKTKLKERAKKDVSLSVRRIYNEEIAAVDPSLAATSKLPTFENMVQTLSRARHSLAKKNEQAENNAKVKNWALDDISGDDAGLSTDMTHDETGEDMEAAHKFLDFQMVVDDDDYSNDSRCPDVDKIRNRKMAEARTSMIDIRVEPHVLNNTDRRSKILQVIKDILLQNDLKKKFEGTCGQSHIIFSSNDSGSLTSTVKTYQFGLITITFEHLPNETAVTNSNLEALRRLIMKKIHAKAETIPPIKRGSVVPVYYTTSDERILEYDFDKILFYEDSPYQNIKILHSPTLGNCLILDDLQNLADCDINYTHGVMKYGVIPYTGKDVLILGGGDGGLLHELLKEDPKFVTMVDIDQMVVDACREHLRGCCGDSLDKLEGPNYKVIIDDCLKLLDQYKNEERKFDVIINDLTDIPIATSPQGELWDFIKNILVKSFAVLKDDGSYLNHAIGEGCIEALETYESVLSNLPEKVTFEKHKAYVPSFMENWVFYEVKKA